MIEKHWKALTLIASILAAGAGFYKAAFDTFVTRAEAAELQEQTQQARMEVQRVDVTNQLQWRRSEARELRRMLRAAPGDGKLAEDLLVCETQERALERRLQVIEETLLRGE